MKVNLCQILENSEYKPEELECYSVGSGELLKKEEGGRILTMTGIKIFMRAFHNTFLGPTTKY